MISGWGATMLFRGMAICGVIAIVWEGLSGNLFEGDNLLWLGIILITSPILWFLPKWMGMTDK